MPAGGLVAQGPGRRRRSAAWPAANLGHVCHRMRRASQGLDHLLGVGRCGGGDDASSPAPTAGARPAAARDRSRREPRPARWAPSVRAATRAPVVRQSPPRATFDQPGIRGRIAASWAAPMMCTVLGVRARARKHDQGIGQRPRPAGETVQRCAPAPRDRIGLLAATNGRRDPARRREQPPAGSLPILPAAAGES